MRWTLKPKPPEDSVKQLQEALQVDEFIATLLSQRGISTYREAKTFLSSTILYQHNTVLVYTIYVCWVILGLCSTS